MRTREHWLALIILSLGLPFLFLGPMLLKGRPLCRDDAAVYIYPQFYAYAQFLRYNQLYLWDANQWSGLPALATGQSMGLYPLHLLLFRFLPWQAAVHIGYALHLALAFIAFVLLAQRLQLALPATIPGAILYTYSGYVAAHLVHYNFVASSAYLPLLLLLLDRAIEKPVLRNWALLSVGAALGFLVMHPQLFLMSLCACLLWLFFNGACSAEMSLKPSRGRLMWGLGLAALVFALLIAPQLLPTIELAILHRHEAEISGIGAEIKPTAYGFQPLDVIRLIVPNLFGTVHTSVIESGPQFHETCAYVGIGGLLTVLAGIVLGLRRRGWAFCLAMLVAGGLLMWPSNPVHQLAARLPFLQHFRAMGRWAILPLLASGLLASFALEEWATASGRRRRVAQWIVTLTALLFAMSLLALWLTFGTADGRFAWPGHPEQALPVKNLATAIYNWLVGWEPIVLFSSLFLATAALLCPLSQNLRMLLLALSIGGPLLHFWTLTNPTAPPDYYVCLPETARVAKAHLQTYATQGEALPRITTLPPALVRPDGWPEQQALDPIYGARELLTPALGTIFGLSYVEGYKQGLVTPIPLRLWTEYWRYGVQAFTGVMRTTAEALVEFGSAAERMERMHRLCGVQLIVTPGKITESMLECVYDGPVRVYKYKRLHPLAWLVGKAIVISDPEEALRAAKRRAFEPDQAAIVDRPVPALPERPIRGRVRCRWGWNEASIIAEADKPALLVIAQAYYPGWQAFVDGRPEPILRANYGFQAVYLPAGSHSITLRFRPTNWRISWILCAAGVVLTALLCIYGPYGKEGKE